MDLSLIFTVLWAAWGVAFLAIEIPALIRRRRGDTLTDHVYWFQARKVGSVPVGWVAFTAAWLGLSAHFFLHV